MQQLINPFFVVIEQEASRIFNVGRDTSFQKTCTDEYLELITEQEVSVRINISNCTSFKYSPLNDLFFFFRIATQISLWYQ